MLGLTFVMVFSTSLAAKDKVAPAINASDKGSFDAVSSWVRKEMTPGGRYSAISTVERGRVDARLDQMSSLYANTADIAHMTEAQKYQMLNDQEEVNAILAKRDNDRVICKREIPVGSHIPVNTCRTAAEIEIRRRNDREYLQRLEMVPIATRRPGYTPGGH